jgi:hypothetical protein
VAGGWSIDLFLGERTREHSDLDISCFRDTFAAFHSSLPGWSFYGAEDGQLHLVDAGQADAGAFDSFWCRPADASTWLFQLILEDREASRWIFRRDRRIQKAVDTICWVAQDGCRVLCPDIQLLYTDLLGRPNDLFEGMGGFDG